MDQPENKFFCPPFESTRRPRNEAEGHFFDLAEEDGWSLTKRGWPDFFMQKNGQLACVEVKPSAEKRLRPHQAIVTAALEAYGIPCYRWSPEGGMVRVDGVRGSSCSSSTEQLERELALKGFGETLIAPSPEKLRGEVDPEVRSKINAVWDCYVSAMNPRQKEAGGEERRMIRKSLEVASVEECRKAILGCASSSFHMGKNDRRKKYNRLSQIIRGRHGKETTRERIDFFIDKLAEAGGASSGVPSASRDLIEQRKRDVQRGHRFRDRPEMVQKAQEAEAWLKEQGITVTRDKDGYPTFRWDGA